MLLDQKYSFRRAGSLRSPLKVSVHTARRGAAHEKHRARLIGLATGEGVGTLRRGNGTPRIGGSGPFEYEHTCVHL